MDVPREKVRNSGIEAAASKAASGLIHKYRYIEKGNVLR
jgi:hypothetical protein